jgi:hypothetical protein
MQDRVNNIKKQMLGSLKGSVTLQAPGAGNIVSAQPATYQQMDLDALKQTNLDAEAADIFFSAIDTDTICTFTSEGKTVYMFVPANIKNNRFYSILLQSISQQTNGVAGYARIGEILRPLGVFCSDSLITQDQIDSSRAATIKIQDNATVLKTEISTAERPNSAPEESASDPWTVNEDELTMKLMRSASPEEVARGPWTENEEENLMKLWGSASPEEFASDPWNENEEEILRKVTNGSWTKTEGGAEPAKESWTDEDEAIFREYGNAALKATGATSPEAVEAIMSINALFGKQ